jgi:hypothetical protein
MTASSPQAVSPRKLHLLLRLAVPLVQSQARREIVALVGGSFPAAWRGPFSDHAEGAPREAAGQRPLKAFFEAKAETSVFAMKSIDLALGIIRTEKKSGSQISFPIKAVEQIARELKGALILEDAQQRLGVASLSR